MSCTDYWLSEMHGSSASGLFALNGTPLPFPVTNMVLVGQKQ
jgi:hypothetical protein